MGRQSRLRHQRRAKGEREREQVKALPPDTVAVGVKGGFKTMREAFAALKARGGGKVWIPEGYKP